MREVAALAHGGHGGGPLTEAANLAERWQASRVQSATGARPQPEAEERSGDSDAAAPSAGDGTEQAFRRAGAVPQATLAFLKEVMVIENKRRRWGHPRTQPCRARAAYASACALAPLPACASHPQRGQRHRWAATQARSARKSVS
jgi:hypothetical protein